MNLLGAGGVVGHDQHAASRDLGPPPRLLFLDIIRNVVGVDAQRPQKPRHDDGRLQRTRAIGGARSLPRRRSRSTSEWLLGFRAVQRPRILRKIGRAKCMRKQFSDTKFKDTRQTQARAEQANIDGLTASNVEYALSTAAARSNRNAGIQRSWIAANNGN